MKKPSDEFRVDETMGLLAQVPGMSFAIEGRQRMTGGEGGAIDSRLKVEDTNTAVEKILGGGLKALNEQGPKSTTHIALHERVGGPILEQAMFPANFSDVVDMVMDIGGDLEVLADDLKDAMKNVEDAAVKKEAQALLGMVQDILKKFGPVDALAKKLGGG